MVAVTCDDNALLIERMQPARVVSQPAAPLKVGDRVEVGEGVVDLVHQNAVPTGVYTLSRDWGDGAIRVEQSGSASYAVRASDVRRV